MAWDRKRINNEIMQLKSFNWTGKENLLIFKCYKVFINLGLLISLRVTEYCPSDPFMFYLSLPNKHTKALVDNPFHQKKISGVWGYVFGTGK